MTTIEAKWWHTGETGRIICDLCPRHCSLNEGQKGFCEGRSVENGRLVTIMYEVSSGFCVDPVEKKPLFHFLPGSNTFSFGTASCNLGCVFCQNYAITSGQCEEVLTEHITAEDIAHAAVDAGCQSVSFTYNDPIISAEFTIDTAKACHKHNLRTIAVTNGYIAAGAREEFFAAMDAANIDLKAFTEDFYVRQCKASLKPVLETIEYVANKTNTWLELTTLLIPGLNESTKEIDQLCSWIIDHLGPNVPLHFSAFHPAHKLLDRPITPLETLLRAYEIAKSKGIHHIYLGNIHSNQGGNTNCASCATKVIDRRGFAVSANKLISGKCPKCGTALAGVFTKSSP